MGLDHGDWTNVKGGKETSIFGAGGSDVELSRDTGSAAANGGDVRKSLVRILHFLCTGYRGRRAAY